jgi:hypothetical protein
MAVEWQGDHRIIGDEIKRDFERELERLRLAQRDFIVEVRREPDLPGAAVPGAMRYRVFVTELEHPDKETWTLDGGPGEDWIGQFARSVRSRG